MDTSDSSLLLLCPAALAQRVASERCESLGDVVGYSIRGDSRVGGSTCLRFCTTGVLIRRLINEPLLEGVTHVVLDEVHERSIEVGMLGGGMLG
jgi:HrpA-like RNA helicase